MLRSDLQTPDIPTLYSVNFYYSRKPATCSDMLIVSVKNERLLLGLGQQLVARSQRTSAPWLCFKTANIILPLNSCQNMKYLAWFSGFKQFISVENPSGIKLLTINWPVKSDLEKSCTLSDVDRHLVRHTEPSNQVRSQVFVAVCENSNLLCILFSIYVIFSPGSDIYFII